MPFRVDHVVPVLRIFDIAKAHEFYVDYLGCTVDWEHRFSPDAPRYLQVSRGSLVLHLSEHHGDGTPGGLVHVYATGVRELHTELAAREYPFLAPGIGPSAGESLEGASIELLDPFGNILRIDERPGR